MTSDCNWEEIHAFASLDEFRRFALWIDAQVEQKICEELHKDSSPARDWDDRWFRCNLSGAIWKLSCPDPGYFPGTWLPASLGENPMASDVV